jgi:predicted nuclease of predicted toxin-antitoxin system
MIARSGRTVRHAPKPKLLIDECLPPRQNFPSLNNCCDVKHIIGDYKMGGANDTAVYDKARSVDRILITLNIKDFRPMIEQERNLPSIIGVSPRLSNEQIDNKVSSFVRSLKPGDFVDKYFKINK